MINLFEPAVPPASVDLLREVFASKWLGRGKYVTQFESELARFQKVEPATMHTLACCSDAIFSAFEILGIHDGEVIVPSVSFPAVGSAVLAARLDLKVVDIDLANGNIDLDALAAAVTPRTRAVFITHYGGIPVDVASVRAIVGDKVRIIEDAACALGTFVDGRACGTGGDFGCWSFDAMKLLTCGEGGAIHIARADEMDRARQHFYLGLPTQAKSGIDRQATDSRWWEYQLDLPGRRSIFTNVNAAIGLPQFQTLAASLDRRATIRRAYAAELDRLGIDYLRQDDARVQYSNYFFTILSDRRDDLAGALKAAGIYSTFRYYPLHQIDLFRSAAGDCPNAFRFSETALNIPIHQSLTDSDVEHIVKSLRGFFAR